MEIQIVVDEAQLRDVRQALAGIADGAPKAIAAAINKTLPQTRTMIVREVQKELNLPYGRILDTMSVYKANASSLTGRVNVKHAAMKMNYFKGAQQTPQGVIVRLRLNEPPQLIKGAFKATMGSGHEGIFKRGGPYVPPQRGKYVGVMVKRGRNEGQQVLRQQIHELMGPTVTGVVENRPGVVQEIQKKTNDQFATNLASQVDRLLAT